MELGLHKLCNLWILDMSIFKANWATFETKNATEGFFLKRFRNHFSNQVTSALVARKCLVFENGDESECYFNFNIKSERT